MRLLIHHHLLLLATVALTAALHTPPILTTQNFSPCDWHNPYFYCGSFEQQPIYNDTTCCGLNNKRPSAYHVRENCTCLFYKDKDTCNPANAVVVVGPDGGNWLHEDKVNLYSCHWIPKVNSTADDLKVTEERKGCHGRLCDAGILTEPIPSHTSAWHDGY